jgi:uncharacterized protein with HEPN domain
MRDDRDRLIDIRNAIGRILEKAPEDRAAFDRDEMLQVWVLHHLQVIGEAARALSDEFRARHPDEIWSGAVGLRNILVHHYFEIDSDLVWNVIERDLPALRDLVERVLAVES